MDQRPIGVFDSGLGGLTAVREIRSILPSENIIYFGDTSRVPYGGRSAEILLRYARQDVRFLRTFDVKALLVACGTVSTNALPVLAAESDIPILGVVEPACAAAAQVTRNKKVGLIATAASVRSGAYERCLSALDGDIQETLDDLFEQLNKAQLQLQSDKYSRLVVYLNLPEESDETMDFLDTMHALIAKYYSSDTYIVGNSTNVKDLSSSFGEDNMLISVLSALFVVIILLFTFKSAGLPVLLIVVIQGSIWINFSVPTIQHESLYFLGYLIVNSIQMGANIDYAIVISSHYTDLKKEMRPKEAIIAALNEAFPTIFTSGTILAVAGALIGVMTTNPVIAAIGTCLGRGTVISIVLVMAVLPQNLLIGDTIVERTSFDVKVPVDLSRVNRTASGNMRVSGRVRGYVNGVIDAEIKGTLNGTLKASVTSGTTIEPTKPDFYLPESKEQAAAEWAENYTEGEEV